MKPKHKKDTRIMAQNWLDHAKSDLKLAKLGLEYEVFPSQICFHAQQAAEKALKAILLYNHIEFPLIHDLEQLLNILEKEKIFIPDDILEVGILTPYAVETRYPGNWDEIAENEITNALTLAEKTIHWAEQNLRTQNN